MPSALATKLISISKERDAQSRESQQAFLEERKMLSTLGPKRWQELRELFQKTISEINADLSQALQWKDVSVNLFQVFKGLFGLSLTGLFDPDCHTLAISGPQQGDGLSYQQKVAGGDVCFVTTHRSENRVMTAEQIVEEALQKLL